jgi:hypothetical protein
MGMPESVAEMAVQTSRDGGYGYILFTPEDRHSHPHALGRIQKSDSRNLGIWPNTSDQTEHGWNSCAWDHMGMDRIEQVDQ